MNIYEVSYNLICDLVRIDQSGRGGSHASVPTCLGLSSRNQVRSSNILRDLWNPGVQYSIHKGLPIIPIMNPINYIPRIEIQIHSNIVCFNLRLGLTYFMVQQPLESFDRPLMRVSLSNSIFATLIFY